MASSYNVSVQFRDMESVIDAYNNRGVSAWSIWQGKQFMFKGYGIEDLQPIVEMLQNAESNATYTLCIYEDVTDPKDIKSKTENDGSFNFRFGEETRVGGLRTIGNAVLYEKLTAIEQRLNEEPEPVKNNSFGIIGEILEHPAIAPNAGKIIEGLLNGIFGLISGKAPGPPTATDNYPVPAIYTGATISGIPDGQNSDIEQLIKRLSQHDPKILEHLQKLLMVAQTDKVVFQSIISYFDTI